METEKDIADIIEKLAAIRPDIHVERLKVMFKADDDRLWYFYKNKAMRVQLESPNGNFPFVIESHGHNREGMIHSLEEALDIIQKEVDALPV